MKEQGNPKRVGSWLLISSLALSASFAVGLPPATSGDLQQTGCEKTPASSCAATVEGHEGKTARLPEGAAAVKVYRDPTTGELVPPPAGAPPAEVPPSLTDAFSTSDEGLVETPSPTPGGGTMVDLQGRFRSPLVATPDADGKITIQHQPRMPVSKDKE